MEAPGQLSADVYDNDEGEDDFVVIQSGDNTPPIDQSLSVLSQADLVATCRKLLEQNQLIGEKLRCCTSDLDQMQQKYKNLCSEHQSQCKKAKGYFDRLSKENQELKARTRSPMSVDSPTQRPSSPVNPMELQTSNGNMSGMQSASTFTSLGVVENNGEPNVLSSAEEKDAIAKEIQDVRSKNSKLQAEIRAWKKKCQDENSKREQAEKEREVWRQKFEEAMSEKNKLEAGLQQSSSRKDQEALMLRDNLGQKEAEMFEIIGQKKKLEAEVGQLKRVNHENAKKVEEVMKQLNQKSNDIESVQRTALDSGRQLKEARDERRQLEETLNKMRHEAEQNKKQVQALDAELRKTNQIAAQLNAENNALKEQNNRLNADNAAASQAANRTVNAGPIPTGGTATEVTQATCCICQERGSLEFINNHLQQAHGI